MITNLLLVCFLGLTITLWGHYGLFSAFQDMAFGLTGPIARGDAATLESHLSAIEERLPGLQGVYRALGRHTLALALQRKGFSGESRERIEQLLDDDQPIS